MYKKHLSSAIAMLVAQNTVMIPVAVGDDFLLEMSYPTIDDVPEAYRALYAESEDKKSVVLSRIVGMKTQADVNNAMGALNNERSNHNATKATLNQILAGRQPDELLQLLDSIPALQAQADAAGGSNIDEQVQLKLNQHVAPVQRNLDAMTTERDTLLQTVTQLQNNERVRIVGDAVHLAATNGKMLPEAIADVKFMAQSIFETNEQGQVVAKDNVPGVTPGISPEVWLTELKRAKPFYWPASVNAGGRGGHGLGASNNPWSKDHWNMTEQAKVFKQDPAKAAQLAEQAGTKVGGAKPA